MSIPIKIKTLLTSKGKKQKEYADRLGIIPQSLQNKYVRQSFTIKELIALGDLTGTSLAFIDSDGAPVIVFNPDDIPE